MISRKSISISILSLSIFSSLLLAPVSASAQKTDVQKVDSVPLFRGASIGVDLFGAIQRQVSDYGQYEANLRVNLKDRYFPVFELGLGDADHESDASTKITLKTRAPYFRIGCDFNIAKHKDEPYRILLGLRYAFTSFDMELSHPGMTDPVWGGTAEYGAKEKYTCHWIEGVFGVDAKVVGPMHLGWTVRYRRRIYGSDVSVGDVWYIPGFGRSKQSCIGGTFNLSFEI